MLRAVACRGFKEIKGVVANHDEDEEEAAGGGGCTPAMKAVLGLFS